MPHAKPHSSTDHVHRNREAGPCDDCTGIRFCRSVILYFYPLMLAAGLALTILSGQLISDRATVRGFPDSSIEVGIIMKESGTVYGCVGGASRVCLTDPTDSNSTKPCSPQWSECPSANLSSQVCDDVAKKLRMTRDASISALVAYILVLLSGILVWFTAALCTIRVWPATVAGAVMLLFGIISSGLVIRFAQESLTTTCATWPSTSVFNTSSTTAINLEGFGMESDRAQKTGTAGVAMGASLLFFHMVFWAVRVYLAEPAERPRGAGTKFAPGESPEEKRAEAAKKAETAKQDEPAVVAKNEPTA
jgi:hypothetical protein